MGENSKNYALDLVNFIDGPGFTDVFLLIGEVCNVFTVEILSYPSLACRDDFKPFID